METIGCTPGSHSTIDWPTIWQSGPEHAAVHTELRAIEHPLKNITNPRANKNNSDYWEFAAPYHVQLHNCFIRILKQ
jgi:hypothetical protein